MAVVVFGSINMDLTTYVPSLPRPGETLFGHSFITVPGGKGANQAVAAARLGAETRLFSRVGDDNFGQLHLQAMTAEGVDTSGVFVDPTQSTGLAVITVDDQAENSIIVISGANMSVDRSDVDRCAGGLNVVDILLLQLEIPLKADLAMAEAASEVGIMVILDPAPAQSLPDELFPLIDVITPNELETEPLVGFPVITVEDAERAASVLREKGVSNVVIKLGAKGAFYAGNTDRAFLPAFSVQAIDTVAAGDAFNAGFCRRRIGRGSL